MLFNSLDFAVFFAVVYGAYVLLPHRGQNLLLLAASYFFYGCWDWRFLSLIAISTTVDFLVAQAIHRHSEQRTRKAFLTVSMVVNLGILGFFKYFDFFVGSAESLLMSMGFSPGHLHLNIVLPVGISFYTFQSMSYTIDVYRRQLVPTKRFLDYALFVSLFTQLVAGPIERASHLLSQVTHKRIITWPNIQAGAWLFFWGLFKKMVIGDNIAGIADQVFSGGIEWGAGTVMLGVYAFALQIFCDFSAYSDMARGLGKFMGFDIMVNFRNPYFATDPSDFWRRWHISLSSWLRDYLYIPLGGNRKGPRRTYVNLMTTMALGGLWHGASWTFVLWGVFHGMMLSIHRWIRGEGKAVQPLTAGPRLANGAAVSRSLLRLASIPGGIHRRCRPHAGCDCAQSIHSGHMSDLDLPDDGTGRSPPVRPNSPGTHPGYPGPAETISFPSNRPVSGNAADDDSSFRYRKPCLYLFPILTP